MNPHARALQILGSGQKPAKAFATLEAELTAEFKERYPNAPPAVAPAVARCGVAIAIKAMARWTQPGHA